MDLPLTCSIHPDDISPSPALSTTLEPTSPPPPDTDCSTCLPSDLTPSPPPPTVAIEPYSPLSRGAVEAEAGARRMMSTSLHQYEQFPPPMQHQHHFAAQHMGPSPLDTLAHTSQYALQFHQNRHVLPPAKGLVKQHRLPYPTGPLAAAPRSQRDQMLHERAGRGAAAAGPVRRRISRACDQCNQLRTKCDGKAPVSS